MNLFLYGTLTQAEVFEILTGLSPQYENAILHNYSRSGIIGKVYPGIAPQDKAMVEGKFLRNIDPRSVEILDQFEGTQYQRTEVSVKINGSHEPAMTYVWIPKLRHLLTKREWDVREFQRVHLESYLVSCKERKVKSE